MRPDKGSQTSQRSHRHLRRSHTFIPLNGTKLSFPFTRGNTEAQSHRVGNADLGTGTSGPMPFLSGHRRRPDPVATEDSCLALWDQPHAALGPGQSSRRCRLQLRTHDRDSLPNSLISVQERTSAEVTVTSNYNNGCSHSASALWRACPRNVTHIWPE